MPATQIKDQAVGCGNLSRSMLHDRRRHHADPREPELVSELRRACCICKRVVQRDGAWVEEVLPPWTPVTHGLCLPCFERIHGPA